jgi:hypothetical protein
VLLEKQAGAKNPFSSRSLLEYRKMLSIQQGQQQKPYFCLLYVFSCVVFWFFVSGEFVGPPVEFLR